MFSFFPLTMHRKMVLQKCKMSYMYAEILQKMNKNINIIIFLVLINFKQLFTFFIEYMVKFLCNV